jgi:hypothetical protein
VTKIHFRAELIDISLKFSVSDREILLNAANSGDTEKIKSALYEAEETLSRRKIHEDHEQGRIA